MGFIKSLGLKQTARGEQIILQVSNSVHSLDSLVVGE